MSEDLTQRRKSCLHPLPNSPASCIIALALILGSLPAVAQTAPTPRPLTILKSTIYETTPWAVTDILPGGRNTPFTGIPMPAMSGADSVALILKDFVIPGLNQPVEIPIELIALNERNVYPLKLGEDEYDFYFTLNPAKRSLGKMTIVQTTQDDRGSRPEGYFLRETDLHLLAVLVPRQRGQIVVTEASIRIASPVPIQFSFDPQPDAVLVRGLVGDQKANWHSDKSADQRNFFIFEGLLQVPLGGRPLTDSLGAHSAAGGSVRTLSTRDAVRDLQGMPEFKPNANLAGATRGVPVFYDNSLVSEAELQPIDITLHYSAASGQWRLNAPADTRVVALNLTSSSGIFTGNAPRNLSGQLDRHTPINVFKLAIGSSFDEVDLGQLTQSGITADGILKDVTARIMLADGRQLSRVRLVYHN